jgi:hypothetical protein
MLRTQESGKINEMINIFFIYIYRKTSLKKNLFSCLLLLFKLYLSSVGK